MRMVAYLNTNISGKGVQAAVAKWVSQPGASWACTGRAQPSSSIRQLALTVHTHTHNVLLAVCSLQDLQQATIYPTLRH
jgi:uncharacterized protein (DUF2237 family)